MTCIEEAVSTLHATGDGRLVEVTGDKVEEILGDGMRDPGTPRTCSDCGNALAPWACSCLTAWSTLGGIIESELSNLGRGES